MFQMTKVLRNQGYDFINIDIFFRKCICICICFFYIRHQKVYSLDSIMYYRTTSIEYFKIFFLYCKDGQDTLKQVSKYMIRKITITFTS